MRRFEQRYRELNGREAFLDLELVVRETAGGEEEGGVVLLAGPGAGLGLDLSPRFRLGVELVELVAEQGGILPLEQLLPAYRARTGHNLDPTLYSNTSIQVPYACNVQSTCFGNLNPAIL